MEEQWKQWQVLFFWGLQNHCRWWMQPWNKKMLTPEKKSYEQPRQHIKKQRHYFAKKGPSSQSYGFFSSNVWMWDLDIKKYEYQRIDNFELWFGEDSWVSLGLQGDQASQSCGKSILNIHWKNWLWSWGPILWPHDAKIDSLEKTLILERLKAVGEGNDKGWYGWIASPTQWTWVWASSRSCWWTGKFGVLQSMG